MKTTIFLFFVLGYLTVFGQINLENTYGEGIVTRVNLENSGEKYYLLDVANNQVKLYNADHSSWKTIPLPTLVGPLDLTIHHLSETKINADSNIEIAYSYYTDNGGIVNNSRIVNELGTVLLDVSDASSIEVSEIAGLPVKVMALIDDTNSSSKVYTVPSLALEHTYSSDNITYDGYITRLKFDTNGEKYYQLDELNNQVKLYNANHTPWKTIDLLPMVGTIDLTIDHISETSINADTKIEVAYTYYDGSLNFEGKISNEDGIVQLTIPDANFIFVDEIAGLSNKLMAHFLNLSTFTFSSKVYTLPSLALEGTYNDDLVTRVNLENSGEKYYISDTVNKQVKLYNLDHTSWKNITLPTATGASLIGITHLSEAVINADNLIEIGYTTFDSSTSKFEARIMNDTGSSLLTVEDGLGIFTSQLAGLPNKLIVPMDGAGEPSKVYGLPTSTLALQKEILINVDLLIYPNPTSDKLTLESKNTSIKYFVITSVMGKIVKEVKQTAQLITIDVSNLSSGTYFIKGQTTDGGTFRSKIIVY